MVPLSNNDNFWFVMSDQEFKKPYKENIKEMYKEFGSKVTNLVENTDDTQFFHANLKQMKAVD